METTLAQMIFEVWQLWLNHLLLGMNCVIYLLSDFLSLLQIEFYNNCLRS
jgi:hypothetical protein